MVSLIVSLNNECKKLPQLQGMMPLTGCQARYFGCAVDAGSKGRELYAGPVNRVE